MYTAAILFCLVGEPHNYINCEVQQAHFKYHTEAQCWAAINGQLERYGILIEPDFEPVSAKCHEWLPMKENTEDL